MAHAKPEVDNLDPEKLVDWIQAIFPNVDGDKIIATIRTVVPVAVGSLIAQLVALLPAVTSWLDGVYAGWQIALGAFVVTAVTGVYYAIARKIESKYPKAGKWLLGSAAKPVYVSGEAKALDDGETGVDPGTLD